MPLGRTRVAPATENTVARFEVMPSPPVVESSGCFRSHRVAPSDGAANRAATQAHGTLRRVATKAAFLMAETVRFFTPHDPVTAREPGVATDGSVPLMRMELDHWHDYSDEPPDYEERNAPVVRHVVIPHHQFTNPDFLVIAASQDPRNAFWVTRVGNEYHLDEMQAAPEYREPITLYTPGDACPPSYEEGITLSAPGELPEYPER